MTVEARQVLVYISRVDLSERTGQASFERGLIDALLRISQDNPSRDVRVLTVASQPLTASRFDKRVATIPLAKRHWIEYAKHQGRLLVAGFRTLRGLNGRDVALFARFSPTMVVPLLLSIIFRVPLVFRTGPVVPSVRAYRGETRWWVLRALFLLMGMYAVKARRIIVATYAIGEWVKRTYPFAFSKVVVVPNGADPPDDLTGPNVECPGFVDDLVPFFRRANLVIAPMPFAHGMATKVIAALAFGKTVLATAEAAAGIPCAPRQLVVAPAEDFARTIAQLLAARPAVDASGFADLREEFGWPNLIARLARRIEERCGKGGERKAEGESPWP